MDHPSLAVAVVIAVNPNRGRAQPPFDSRFTGMALEMVDELVARGEHRRALGETPAGQMRKRAARVQAQPVVPGSPRGSNLFGPVKDQRVNALVKESQRR